MKVKNVNIQKEEEITEEVVEDTLKRALRCYSTLQAQDGFWPGDYAGAMFMLPGLVTANPFLFFF